MPRTRIENLWLGGAVVLALLLSVIGYFFVVGPQRTRTTQVRSQVDAAQLEAATLQSRIISLTSEQKKLAAYRAALTRARAALPTAGDLSANPALLRSLQVAAQKSSVTISSLTVGDPAAVAPPPAPSTTGSGTGTAPSSSPAGVATTTPVADLYSVDITAGVTGSGRGVLEFLTDVQYRLPRALFISSVTVGSATSPGHAGSEILALSMTAFVRPSPASTTTAAGAGATPTPTTSATP